MPRGTGRVYKRGETWWIQYNHRGETYRETSRSKNVTNANRLLRRRLAETSVGRPRKAAEHVTLEDLHQLIITDYAIKERRSKVRMEQAWAHIAEWFGPREKAVDITAPRLDLYLKDRMAEGASAQTARVELAALRRAFNLAKKKGVLQANECPGGWPEVGKGKVRKGFFTEDQQARILAALPEDVEDLVEYLFWTGWRVSEAQNLQWKDVDLRAKVIRIEETKNSEARTLPYYALPALVAIINRRRELWKEQGKLGRVVPWVFFRCQQGKQIRHFRRSWKTACVAAGLGHEVRGTDGKLKDKIHDRLVHDIRRTAARNMLRAGLSKEAIKAIGGWKTDSMFYRYAIQDEVSLAEELAKRAKA